MYDDNELAIMRECNRCGSEYNARQHEDGCPFCAELNPKAPPKPRQKIELILFVDDMEMVRLTPASEPCVIENTSFGGVELPYLKVSWEKATQSHRKVMRNER